MTTQEFKAKKSEGFIKTKMHMAEDHECDYCSKKVYQYDICVYADNDLSIYHPECWVKLMSPKSTIKTR